MKTKMPDTVYLFPTRFTIEDISREESATCTYKGRTNYGRREIRIEPTLHSEDKKSVMLHEIVHCILRSAAFDDQHEGMVEVLANGFLNIIRGNKKLIAWLSEIE